MKSGVIKGAVILSAGSVLAKIFSAVYRILLTRILGGEGIGVYQLIFPFYSLCVVLATAGLPMAISKIVASNPKSANSIVKKCFAIFSVFSLLLTTALILLSGVLSSLQGEPRLYICYLILAPTIILVSGASILRGYFQGKKFFTPSALSNVIEQLVKMIFGLILCLIFIKKGLIYAIVGAMIAIVISEVVSLAILLLFYKFSKKNAVATQLNCLAVIKEILPITLTNIILPLASFVDSLIVVNLLKINFSPSMAVFMYGLDTGAVSTLTSLPTLFSFALACSIMPALASNKKSGNKKTTLAINTVLFITLPCVFAFIAFPKPLMQILYGNSLNNFGLKGLNLAYNLLRISSVGIIFFSVNQIFSVSLQAVENRYVTIKNLSIAVTIKFFVQIIFLPSKALNIYALGIANSLCYFVVWLLNRIELKKLNLYSLDVKFLLKVLISSTIMLLVLTILLKNKFSIIYLIISILISGLVYILSMMLLNVNFKKNKRAFKKY